MSAVYVSFHNLGARLKTNAALPRGVADRLGAPIASKSEKIATTTTSAAGTKTAPDNAVVRLIADTDSWVAFGTGSVNAVTVENRMLLKANVEYIFPIASGEKVYAAALASVDKPAVNVVLSQSVGANNVVNVTATVVDEDGVAVAAVHELDLWFSDAATGIGLTSTTYSGTLVASVGAILTALTAKKHFKVVTAATGIFTGALTDTAETAGQYAAAAVPATGKVVVSGALVWG